MESNVADSDVLLKPTEVAKRLQIGISTVYHLAHRGVLPGIKIGGTLRFHPQTLTKYLKDLEKKEYGTAA